MPSVVQKGGGGGGGAWQKRVHRTYGYDNRKLGMCVCVQVSFISFFPFLFFHRKIIVYLVTIDTCLEGHFSLLAAKAEKKYIYICTCIKQKALSASKHELTEAVVDANRQGKSSTKVDELTLQGRLNPKRDKKSKKKKKNESCQAMSSQVK